MEATGQRTAVKEGRGAHQGRLAVNLAVVAIALIVAVALSEIGLRSVGYPPAMLDRRMFVASADTLRPLRLPPGDPGWDARGLAIFWSFRERVGHTHMHPPVSTSTR